MTHHRCGVSLALLLLAACPLVQAQQVVISDAFTGENGTPMEGRWPDAVNLPGGTWIKTGEGLGASLNAVGLAAFVCSGDSSGAIALPISSQGAYVKPSLFTISADLGALNGGAHPLLGFYSTIPVQATKETVATNFTGLKLVCNGNGDPANGTLVLYQNGVAGTSVKYTGTFNLKAIHRLSYDVNTATGAISNVRLEGSSSDYSVFRTNAFTNAATAYAGVAVLSVGRDTQACANQFKIVADKGSAALLPNTAPPSPPTGLTAIKGKLGWNSVQLDWKKSFGSYNVYRGVTPGGESETPIVSGLMTQTYTDRRLTDDSPYYYKVKATNPYGSSDSNEVSFTVVNPLYRDQTAYPPFSLNWNVSTDLQQVTGIFPHPTQPGRAIVATQEGALLTDDAGRTWTNLPEAAAEKVGPICDIAFHPILPDTFYLASRTKGVWVTTDNGKTFSQIGTKARGMAADAVASLIVYPGDFSHQTLLAVHGGAAAGLSRSRDGGTTWDAVNTEYHFSRLFGAYCNMTQLYLFGSTTKEPDIQSVYTCRTVGESLVEVVRDVVPTDLVFAPVPWRHAGFTYVATSDSGLYRIDNTSQFGMSYDVKKLDYPGVDGWASVGVTWGPSADVTNLYLYDPAKLGLVVVSQDLANKAGPGDDLTASVTASDGLPVSPLTKEGAVLRPNANGTVCYAVANGALAIGRAPADVPVVNFVPSAFEMNPGDEKDWKDLAEAFSKFDSDKGATVEAAKALCQQMPDLESLYRHHQITVTARVPIKTSPPHSVTIDLSRYGGLPDTPLYHDGQHDDGADGDGVYGTILLFLPSLAGQQFGLEPEWRSAAPGRVAMGVVATYADGSHRGAVGTVNISQQLLDLNMWDADVRSADSEVEGVVTAEPFLNPLAPNQPAYASRRHRGDLAVRLKVPKGPWAVHFKLAYNKHNIENYAGLSLFLRLEAGEAPKELNLQLRDEPEFSPPTTTNPVPLLRGLTLNGEYRRVVVPMNQVLGTSQLQTDHLSEIIISGDSAAPATLVIDGMEALATYPPPSAPEPAQ